MLNSSFKLYFKINAETYLGGSVRSSHEKVELFFHYPWGSRTEAKMIDLRKAETRQEYMPDHISFHADGTIHLKRRDGRKKTVHLVVSKVGQNIFNLERGHFLPIFVESIDLSKKTLEKRFKKESFNPKEGRLFDLTGLNSFSILFISKCSKIDPTKLVKDHGLENLRIITGVILAEIFKISEKDKLVDGSKSNADTDLLILITRNIMDPFSDSPKVENAAAFSQLHFMPSIKKINKMIDLNS